MVAPSLRILVAVVMYTIARLGGDDSASYIPVRGYQSVQIQGYDSVTETASLKVCPNLPRTVELRQPRHRVLM